MSLSFEPIPPVPQETVPVAKAAFPKGNPYLTLIGELGPIFGDADFANLFSLTGQPAVPPWRLALITLMQFRGLSCTKRSTAINQRTTKLREETALLATFCRVASGVKIVPTPAPSVSICTWVWGPTCTSLANCCHRWKSLTPTT